MLSQPHQPHLKEQLKNLSEEKIQALGVWLKKINEKLVALQPKGKNEITIKVNSKKELKLSSHKKNLKEADPEFFILYAAPH